ncbi:MAG TPA: hypothetical protein VKC89_03065 [Patescibacteria group bacterium]|nr:hypothetical protein [Patescibacteria group bacterium]
MAEDALGKRVEGKRAYDPFHGKPPEKARDQTRLTGTLNRTLTRRNIIRATAAGAVVYGIDQLTGGRLFREPQQPRLEKEVKFAQRGQVELLDGLTFRTETNLNGTPITLENVTEVYGTKHDGKNRILAENLPIVEGENPDKESQEKGEWFALKAKYKSLGIEHNGYLFVNRSYLTSDVVKSTGTRVEISQVFTDGSMMAKNGEKITPRVIEAK